MIKALALVVDPLRWMDEIESDLSVFHRVDDFETLTVSTFLTRVALLPAYGGALALRLQPIAAAAHQPAPRVDPENTPDQEVAAKWQQALLREFPDAVEGGIEVVSDTEMERMLTS